MECLEADEWPEGDEEGGVVRQAKEGIVLLLHQVLPTSAPNLAHFLLGYQLNEDVSIATLLSIND